jgi:phosphoketolase
MDDKELLCLYTGYGYQVRFVEYGPLANSTEEALKKERRLNADMAVSIDWAYNEIKKIQTAARSGNPIVKPRWPMIILRTPKVCTVLYLIPRLLIYVAGHDGPALSSRLFNRRIIPLSSGTPSSSRD